MEAYYSWLNSLVNKCKSEYAAWPDLKWLNAYDSIESFNLRKLFIEKLGDNHLFKGTKPYYKGISRGCQICGEGQWSCLFITNKCNAGCFYCPVPQIQDETPGTQGFDFDNPAEYANYVNHFGFKGVSFSGGEPLLYFDRTLSYLKEIRKRCDKGIYIWMYTNGILADRDKMKALAEHGLDEIRFDIGATGFKLDKIAYAKGIIPNITIEIPAVPEEKDKLKLLLPEMIKVGVTNLNLHQMRLTPHNVQHLSKRNYTYIPAEKPIVLESELAALEIVTHARELGYEIGINYCSFFFKNRFQKSGFRKQLAKALNVPQEGLTENGYIRRLTNNTLEYSTVKMYNEKQHGLDLQELRLDNKLYHFHQVTVLREAILNETNKTSISQFLNNTQSEIPSDKMLFRIWRKEFIEEDLRPY